jgi:UDP-3-O-[3-hydroxymyristoyl] glucosamine N-acyltransferase
MEQTLAALCGHLHGELIGDGTILIRGVSGTDQAEADQVTFAEDDTRLAEALAGRAAAVIVSKDVKDLGGRPGIRVEHPKLAFALLLELFYPEVGPATGVHPTAILGKRVILGDGVAIGPHAVLGEDVSVGAGTTIGSGVSVGDGVTIGARCAIDANVVIYRHTKIGDRVIIHGGTVIGGDGFGYVLHQGAYVKVPQVGNVVIEDDVELGCNVCVDRATVGSTVIRRGTKIDNLVQIGHNDHIGKHTVLSGQVGLSGSVRLGDYVVMGGKAGVVDHVTVGDHAQVGAASVVTKAVGAGEIVWGYPARALAATKRQMAALARLPQVLREIKSLMAGARGGDARLDRPEPRAGGRRPRE